MAQDDTYSGEPRLEPETYEHPGADQEGQRDDVPNAETGVGVSMGDATSFEPEEDPEAAAGDGPDDQPAQ